MCACEQCCLTVVRIETELNVKKKTSPLHFNFFLIDFAILSLPTSKVSETKFGTVKAACFYINSKFILILMCNAHRNEQNEIIASNRAGKRRPSLCGYWFRIATKLDPFIAHARHNYWKKETISVLRTTGEPHEVSSGIQTSSLRTKYESLMCKTVAPIAG